MEDRRYDKELVHIAVDLWSRDIKSIAELNQDAVEDISNKYGEDCLSTLDAILTRNWDKWNQEMEDYFQKQKKSENENGAISTL